MWPSHIAKPLKRAPVKRSAEDGEDLARRCMGDLRGRHGMFRMPGWMSEDEDMTDLAHRMSHAPHFATMGRRGGPWRERRSSGGSAMSATSEDDSCDAAATDKSSQCSGGSAEVPSTSHEIPIRIEAPAPPSATQQHPQTENEPVAPLRSHLIGKSPQHPVRTTSAVDASDHSRDVPRSTRCASAPPEMADQHMQGAQSPQQQRFVSKINITPQAPQSPGSPQARAAPASPLPAKFNTVPKPFIPANKANTPMQEQQQQQQPQHPHENQQPPHMQYPQSHQPQQQVPPQTPPQYQQQYHPQQHPQFHHQQPQFQQQQYHQAPHPQQQQSPRQSGQRPSVVRNIPIFVEGRDGPLVNEESGTPPKPSAQWGHQWQHQQPHQQPHHPQNQAPQPQPQQHRQQFKQQNHAQQPQPQSAPIPMPEPQSVPIPMPEPQPHFQPQQQTPPQQQQQQPQQQPEVKPQQPPKDPRLSQIETVKALVDEYRSKVEAFSGSKKSRDFLYLDEMLTRALLQLDNVDPDGRDDVRQARRAVIKDINAAISLLESKATEPKKEQKEKTPTPADTQEAATEAKADQKSENKEVKEQPADKPEGDAQTQENPQVGEEAKKEEAQNTTEAAGGQQAESTSEVNQKESEEKKAT